MTVATERRFHPPKERKHLLDRLIGDDSPFGELRDVLFFALVLGWRTQSRKALEGRGDGIRWGTMCNRLGTEAVIGMLAAAEIDDPEILVRGRSDERIAVAEEYAHGGLVELERRLTMDPRGTADVILDLIQEYLGSDSTEPDGIQLTKEMLTF